MGWYHMNGRFAFVAETETNFNAMVNIYKNFADKWVSIRMIRKLAADGTYPYFCYMDDELVGTIPNTATTQYTVTVCASDPWHGFDVVYMKNLRFASLRNIFFIPE